MQLACEKRVVFLCPLTRYEHEMGLELDCLRNTEIFLGVAQGKIVQSHSTISQLDQQFINQNLGFVHVNLCGLWPKALPQPPVSVLIKFQPVFLKKKSWDSGTVNSFFFSFFSEAE